jgi:hypothetical protein
MTIAFVLVNYDLGMGTEQEVIKKLKNVPGVIYVSEVSRFYDIVVKITSGSLKSLKKQYLEIKVWWTAILSNYTRSCRIVNVEYFRLYTPVVHVFHSNGLQNLVY